MTTIIKKSSFKSFLGSLAMAIFTFAIGIALVVAPRLSLFSEAGGLFNVLFPIMGLIGCFFGISQFKSSLAFLGVQGGWRVEIADETLRWDSPLEELQKSFKVNLDEIKYIESVRIESKDTVDELGSGVRNRYVIHMTVGPKIHLRDDISGIWPHRVFKDLEKRGIKYVHTCKAP